MPTEPGEITPVNPSAQGKNPMTPENRPQGVGSYIGRVLEEAQRRLDARRSREAGRTQQQQAPVEPSTGPVMSPEMTAQIEADNSRAAQIAQEVVARPENVRAPRGSIREAKEEIFGSQAFSREWAKGHGLPEKIDKNPLVGIHKEFRPEEVLSEILETGFSDPTSWNRANMAIDTEGTTKEFRIAARNGLLHAMAVNNAMKTGRFDSVVEIMKSQYGLTPQGMSQWILEDLDTRRALTKLFELQGYKVPPTKDLEGKTVGDPTVAKPAKVEKAFSDPDIKSRDVKAYLDEVSKELGVDRGVVIIAYTIFRALGFPQENGKYGDLYDHVKEGTLNVGKDKRKWEVAPFIQKMKDTRDSKRYLDDVLEQEGVIGLARSLNLMGEAEIARAWGDTDMMLTVADAAKDARLGVGSALGLRPNERRNAIMQSKELGILVAKRRVSPETYYALIDAKVISKSPSLTNMTFMEAERDFWGDFIGDFTGMFKRKKRDKIG